MRFVSLVLMMLLSGCSASIEEQQASAENQYRQSLAEASELAGRGRPGLLRQLADEAFQGRQMQWVWETQLMLCQTEADLSSRQLACVRAMDAARLLGHADVEFISALAGYLHGESSLWSALVSQLASSPMQQMQWRLARGDWSVLEDAQFSLLSAQEQAQAYYLRGKSQRDMAALEQAQTLLEPLNLPVNLADVLFLRARWSEPQQAQTLAARAALLLEAARQPQRAAQIRSWMDDRSADR